jgi:transcriptional antiterminator RfaH
MPGSGETSLHDHGRTIAWAAADRRPRWYVVHTKPNNEQRVEHNLRVMRLETLCPMLADDCDLERARRPRVRPLFPSYLFGRFSVLEHWHSVRFTRGVKEVLSADGLPIPVDEDIVRIVASRVDADGLVHIGRSIRPGQPVVVRGGPFNDLLGILEAPANDHERATVLLTAINWSARVEIAREHVHPA